MMAEDTRRVEDLISLILECTLKQREEPRGCSLRCSRSQGHLGRGPDGFTKFRPTEPELDFGSGSAPILNFGPVLGPVHQSSEPNW